MTMPSEMPADFDIKEYLQRLIRHWRMVLVITALCVAGGVVHYAITPKEYMARVLMQIERRSLLSQIGSTSPWIESWWNMEFYPTQVRLLQSRGLAERVVDRLRLMEDPAFVSADAAEGEATAKADEAIRGQLASGLLGGLGVRQIPQTQLVELTYRSGDPHRAADLVNEFAEAFIDLGKGNRQSNAQQASEFFTAQIGELREEIAEREVLLQDVSRRTDIVDLEPESNVVLQRLRALNQDYIEAKKERIEKESRYQEILNTPPENVADSYLGGEVTGLRGELLNLEQQYYTKLVTFKPEHPSMKELSSQIDKAKQNLDNIIQENAAKARDKAYAEFQAARRQEAALDGEISQTKSQNMTQRSQAVEYINLEEEVRTRRELLSELLRRQNETAVAFRLQNTNQSNIQVIDKALVPGGAFRPSLRQDLLLGLSAGLLLGLGLAALREFLDRTVKTGEELERLLGLPTLAVIPDVSGDKRSYGYFRRYGAAYGYGGAGPRPRTAGAKSGVRRGKRGDESMSIELLPHSRPRLAVAEAYRSLRTALMLSSAQTLKAVAVTSAEAGEGKTSTASNLAIVMAQLGRNVLLIDADLRKPRQHQVFRISNRIGLVSHLTGTAEADAILERTEVPNLYVCPSGPIPPNPSELLSSERMEEFLRLVCSRFDFVIIDTPPTLAVTDSTLVGAMTDGVILCCRAGFLQRDHARAVRDQLQLAEVRILGTVLNFFQDSGGAYGSSRKYRYYESYGYGAEPGAEDSRTDSAA